MRGGTESEGGKQGGPTCSLCLYIYTYICFLCLLPLQCGPALVALHHEVWPRALAPPAVTLAAA